MTVQLQWKNGDCQYTIITSSLRRQTTTSLLRTPPAPQTKTAIPLLQQPLVLGTRSPPLLLVTTMVTLGNTAMLLGPEPEERGIQIRTLREHELNNVRAVEVSGCTPWKPPGWRKNLFGITAPSAKEDCNPGTWVFASEKGTQRSCSSGAKHPHAMVCNSTSSTSSASVNVTRSADVEDRSLLCRQQENHAHSCEGVLGSVAINFGSSTSTGAVTSTQATSAAGSAMSTTAEDGIYDPEELLLEPLLSSPRSDRERRARSSSESGPGNCTYDNNMLHDARVMSHCIGSNHHVPLGMNARGDGEMSSLSSGIVSSAMHSSSFLSRPLVPVSPSLSGAQGSSFISGGDQSPRSCAVEVGAVAGAGGGVVGDNGTWYLNFPPGNQQHQRYQSHLHHASTSAVASAAKLAAEAANVAAAIQQATGPFSAHHIGSSYAPPCANDISVGAMGMRTSDANDVGGGGSSACSGESGSGLVGSGGGICSVDYHHYPDESRTSWSSTTSVSTPSWQPPGRGAPGRTSSGRQTGGTPQRPRFVTREECVPGSCHTHGDPEWLVPFGAFEGSRTPGIQQMHSLANNSLYARSANHGLGGGDGGGKRMKVLGAEDVSQGWISLPRSVATSTTSVGITAGSNRNSTNVNGMDISNGWRSSGLSIRANGGNAIAAESSPSSDASTAVPDSATPSRRSGGTHVSAASATSAARADLDQSLPEGSKHRNSDDDSTVGVTESVGDSSPEWADREESEEEIKASLRNKDDSKGSDGGGRGGGSGGSKSSKVPFMLDPKLWIIVERRAVCSAKQCAYRSEDDHRARRRHYHALCSHVHQNGERKGMRFQHHQLEKVQKHQRAHQVSAKQVQTILVRRNTQRTNVGKSRTPTGSPTPRNKRSSAIHGMKEQSWAIKDANLEAHSPKDWTPELTQRLRDLVDELGPKWSAVAEKIPGKTATACMLHWRVSLNPNHMVKGSGTWTAEEDERLSKLVEVVGMKWSDLARHIPGRIAKQCRERYLNHLDPSLRKDMPWTEDEEALLMRLCFAKQNQWAEICRQLHGRSYNDVKNRFNLVQRRNKRAQGSHSPATSSPPTFASSAVTAYKSTRAEQQPSRRGAKNATRTTSSAPLLAPAPSSSAAAAASSSSTVSDSSYTSSCGQDGSYHGSTMPRARGVCSSSSPSSAAMAAVAAVQTPVIFAPATAGWGSTPAPAPASLCTNSFLSSASSAATADGLYEDHRAVAQSGVGHAPSHAQQQQNTTSSSEPSSSSFDLIRDELGEFGIDGPESGSPGSGFAPGGYWHQMVKEESRMARGSDDEGVHDGIDEDDYMGERSEDGRGQNGDLPVGGDGDLADARRWGAIGPVSGDDDVRLIKVDPNPTTTVARFPQNGLPLP